MSPRPDPAGTKNTDELARRRYLQSWLRPPYALDAREQRRHLDEGNTDAVARGARRVALDEWVETVGSRYVLTEQQLEELTLFLEDRGPRPGFAWPFAPGQYGTTDELAAHDLAVAERNAPPARPDADGRFPGQEPSGRFARAGDPGFDPDRR